MTTDTEPQPEPKPPRRTPMDRHRERQATDPEYRAQRVAKATAWIKANHDRHLDNVRAYHARLRVLKETQFSNNTISAQ